MPARNRNVFILARRTSTLLSLSDWHILLDFICACFLFSHCPIGVEGSACHPNDNHLTTPQTETFNLVRACFAFRLIAYLHTLRFSIITRNINLKISHYRHVRLNRYLSQKALSVLQLLSKSVQIITFLSR